MTFWITFPFWFMVVLIALNAFVVSRMDIDVKDDDANSQVLNH